MTTVPKVQDSNCHVYRLGGVSSHGILGTREVISVYGAIRLVLVLRAGETLPDSVLASGWQELPG
jgi:hypothetical protein